MPLDALSSGARRLGPDCSLCFWRSTMQLALLIYMAFRLLCGDGNQPEPTNTAHAIGEHRYMILEDSDDPVFATIGSEMLTQHVIRTGLTQEQLKLAAELPLYQQLAKVPVDPHIISKKEISKLRGNCRYLRASTELYYDRFKESKPLITIHNGVYFVMETRGQWAKILLPVKGGYVAYYMPESHLTDKIEEAQDFEHTMGCMDTMTPEKCSSCWPHEHHRPILLP